MNQTTKQSPLTILKELESLWSKAASNWDPEALTALYTDDALFFGGLAEMYKGKSIRKYFEFYKGNILSASLNLYDMQFIELAPDTYLAQGYAHFTGKTVKGPMDLRNRSTWIFSKRNGIWKLLGHHFSSVPTAPPV